MISRGKDSDIILIDKINREFFAGFLYLCRENRATEPIAIMQSARFIQVKNNGKKKKKDKRNMADKMIFPIGFDLDKAVKEASGEWDSKYADRLEKAIRKRAIKVKLDIDPNSLNDLETVKRRLSELKLEPITKENKRAIRKLARELEALAKALEKVQKYSVKSAGAAELRGAKVATEVQKANAEAALASQRAAREEYNLAAAHLKRVQAANGGIQTTDRLTGAYKRQADYVSRLIKRLAVYAGFQQITNFLTNVREVTAQFELQKVSLGAIIQDQTKANKLFSEIKSFALQSPVKILDLTKYTKQLAAYQIEYDKLFDTTKRLADISVGLGVSMDRLILAYGQIKATGYLRASEVRQLTEAGLPIVEQLAKKLTEANGELVRAKDVMDMISKREIPFEMVADVFADMTDKGGIFYNMQVKQGNTLYGMWQKLGDAASVMYDEIGNTGVVNDGMRMLIQGLTSLMRHWDSWAKAIASAVVVFGAIKVVTMTIKANTIAMKANTKAAVAMRTQNIKGNKILAATNWLLQKCGMSANRATAYVTVFGKALRLIGGIAFGAVIWGLTSLVEWLWRGDEAAGELASRFSEIEENYRFKKLQDHRNFENLAETAVNADEGTKKQKEALEELNRTYKDALGVESIRLETLQAMNHEYSQAINLIDQYNAKLETEEKLAAVKDVMGKKVKEAFEEAEEELATYGVGSNEIGHAVAVPIMLRYKEAVSEAMRMLSEDEIGFSEYEKRIEKAYDDYLEDLKDIYKSRHGDGIFTGEELEETAAKYASDVASSTASEMHDMLELMQSMSDEEVKIKKEAEQMQRELDKYYDLWADIDNIISQSREDFAAKMLLQGDKGYQDWIDAAHEDMEAAQQYLLGSQEYKQALKQIETDKYWIKIHEDDARRKAAQLGNTVTGQEYLEKTDMRGVNALVRGLKKITDTQYNFDSLEEGMIKLDEIISTTTDIEKQNALTKLRTKIEELFNTDPQTKVWQDNFRGLATEMAKTTPEFDKMGNRIQQYMMKTGESLKEYSKRIKDSIKTTKESIKELQAGFAQATKKGYTKLAEFLKGKEEEAQMIVMFLEMLSATLPNFDTDRSSGNPRSTRRQEYMDEIQLVEKLYKEYKDLAKLEGEVKAEKDTRKLYAANLKELKDKYKIELPTDFEGYSAAIDVLIGKLKELRKQARNAGERRNIDIAIRDALYRRDKAGMDEAQKEIEAGLKELADRISRTKTAKEFYEKILGQTGDVDLAANVTMSIYGDTGEGLFDSMVEQIRQTFTSGDKDIDLQIGAEIDTAIDTENERINYKALADIYDKYQDQIIEKNRDTAQKIVSEGQKTAASNIATWEKELAKAKSFEEQRTDIINRETQRRAEIIKSNLPQEEKDRLIGQSQNQQDKEISDLNWKEFKESDDYIKIFENLDNVSTAALRRLRENLEEVKTANADLSPENMKALVKAMEDIDNQLDERGFGNVMVQSVKDYIQAMRDLKTAKAELQATQAEYDAQEPTLDAEIDAAKQEKIDAQTALNLLKQNELATDSQIISAQLRLLEAAKQVELAENKKAQAADKVKKAEQKVTDQQDKQKKATSKFFKDMQQVAQTADQLASELSDVKDLLGISEDSAAGLVFDSAVSGLQAVSKVIAVVTAAQAIYNAVCMANPYIAAAAGVLAVFSAIGSFLTSSKVKKANKEIKRQQKILDQLEYTYGRLEKAAEKAFGGDYISSFKQQQQNLEAQAAAYQKQADAEKSKGKKADEEKIKEYEDKYRDTMDKIEDMQGQIAAQMLGTDLTSAARDFAKAWLEAYKEFGHTADKMGEKFREMIENMIVEGAMAKVMERALKPMFDMIDNMDEEDFYSESFWKNVVANAEQGAQDADAGASTLMKFLEQAGISIRDLGGDMTGISRDIATASEESINGLAAHMNTVEHYVALIQRDVSAMAMRGGATGAATALPSVDYTPLIQQSLANQNMMIRYQAETVTVCRNIAYECKRQADMMKKVIVSKDATGTAKVYVGI